MLCDVRLIALYCATFACWITVLVGGGDDMWVVLIAGSITETHAPDASLSDAHCTE